MDRLETVLNDAAGQLPDGYEVGVYVSKDFSPSAVIKYPDDTLDFSEADSVCDQVKDLIRSAIAHAESANMEANEKAYADKCRDQALREDEYERQRRGE
jgi:hypothetical protein